VDLVRGLDVIGQGSALLLLLGFHSTSTRISLGAAISLMGIVSSRIPSA
jgi:hypothetical protein